MAAGEATERELLTALDYKVRAATDVATIGRLYVEIVGYDLVEDDPTITLEQARALALGVIEEAYEAAADEVSDEARSNGPHHAILAARDDFGGRS